MSAQINRQSSSGRINRERIINFTFNGIAYQGYEGDTLASALLANGVRVVGRGFKFHRPRGIFSAGVEEPNALVTIGQDGFEEASVRATVQPLYEGLVAKSQNCWPSVNFDIGRTTDYLSALFPAGFYNKTFKWPNWNWYEGFIRRAAGLAELAPEDDPDRYIHKNVHCDLLIVGGGVAGITAALTAAGSEVRVVLAEQDVELGGSLLWQENDDEWLAKAHATLERADNVTILTRTSVSAYFDHNFLLATERLGEQQLNDKNLARERLWKIRAKQIILATGAHEQPLLFPNNDRPGILQASALRHYLNRYAVAVGKRIAIATNNDSAYQTALDFKQADLEVACIVDVRSNPSSDLVRQAREQGITLFQNAVIADTSGSAGITAIKISSRRQNQNDNTNLATIHCDCLGVSGGWQPVVHLLSQARGKLGFDKAQAAFLPKTVPENFHVVGSANGTLSLSKALVEAEQATNTVLSSLGVEAKAKCEKPALESLAQDNFNIERVVTSFNVSKQWIDYQHDVTLRDIDITVDEKFVSVEHLKRYTTTGMSVDQGKTSNINALSALAARTNRNEGEVGTTTFRPFFTPVTLGSIAGQRRGEYYSPVQRTPMYDSQAKMNAIFHDYGTWRRPAWYAQGEETKEQAIAKEVKAVRNAVGLFDGSPLGKIEVRGKDAALFLNRLYVNNILTMQPGKSRYALMCNENGIIIDDGIMCCLAEGHFLTHTSSAGATRIYAWMESWLQGEWPDLDVILTSVSTQWANIAVSGPNSRELIGRLGMSVDLDNEAFPHMAFRQSDIDGIPIRIMRATFTGECGYEINIPADYGLSLWDALLELGQDLGAQPIGLESLNVLRAEKGYLHVGGDTDGTSTPLDIGWARMIEKKKEFFVGKRSLSRPQQQSEERLHFIGLSPVEDKQRIEPGEHILAENTTTVPAPTQGYVTSACYSPTLERYIALALIQQGRERIGEKVKLYNNGTMQMAEIVAPAFYDPKGERLSA